MSGDTLVFYHSPRTRASSVMILLEELEASYQLRVLNLKLGEQRKPDYLAINPLGKVPALVHNGELITELGACFIYLADAFPRKGLAPPIGDPLRGPYLRWLVFYGSSFEPAVMDKHLKREPGPQGQSPYGDFDAVMALINTQLASGPYLFGQRFTAADILWGSALRWTTTFGLVPSSPQIAAYVERIGARPSVLRVAASDAELAKIHDAAAASR